jgi:hypothetical protein
LPVSQRAASPHALGERAHAVIKEAAAERKNMGLQTWHDQRKGDKSVDRKR